MSDERVLDRDGVLGPSVLRVGVFGNNGANAEGSMVLGGVFAIDASAQVVLLVSGVVD